MYCVLRAVSDRSLIFMAYVLGRSRRDRGIERCNCGGDFGGDICKRTMCRCQLLPASSACEAHMVELFVLVLYLVSSVSQISTKLN